MTRLKVSIGSAVVLLVAMAVQEVGAAITSTPFSFGYGRTGKYSSYPPTYYNDPNYIGLSEWNELEANNERELDPNGVWTGYTVPASDPANTPHTQGDFTFDVTIGATTGTGNWSGGGPSFIDRVIADGAGPEFSSNGSTFTVDIDGSYNGTPQAGYSTRVVIDQISLYYTDGRVCGNCGFPGRDGRDGTGPAALAEVTLGNEGTSDWFVNPTCASLGGCTPELAVDPNATMYGVLGTAGHYVQMIWDPADPDGTLGENAATRTFNVILDPTAESSKHLHAGHPMTNDDMAVDGFEVFGTVQYISESSSDLCDFDGSGTCGLVDINLLMNQGDLTTGVAVGTGNKFDLNSDNTVNEDDITEWLVQTGSTNGFSSAMLRGDTDQVGVTSPTPRTVDITDFQNFLGGFTGAGSTWEVGNFDGNGVVDITDFSNHFLPSFAATGGGTYGSGQVVPEPSAVLLLGLGGVLLTYVCFQKRGNKRSL